MPRFDDFQNESEFKSALKSIQDIENLCSELGEGNSHTSKDTYFPDLTKNSKLKEYELLQCIGRGGMGVVYKARHKNLNKVVAMKRLSHATSLVESAYQQFDDEILAVGKLDHPNLVRAIDAREIEGVKFLITEYVEGIDLEQLVDTIGPIAPPVASEIIRQTAAGLAHAHQQGIVHRDIKPSNIMLSSTGTIKVLDLGLARNVAATRSAIECSDRTADRNLIMGTLDFMPPEQARTCPESDHRSDIYSLGMTFHYLLSGVAPFEHIKGKAQKIDAQLFKAPAPLPLKGGQGKRLNAFLKMLVAKNPNDRIQQMSTIENSMQRLCDKKRFRQFLLDNAGALSDSPKAEALEIGSASNKLNRLHSPILTSLRRWFRRSIRSN